MNSTGARTLRRAVGMAWQRRAGTQPAEQSRYRRTQPADSPPGTGLKETTATRWPASQQNIGRRQSWPASRRAVQISGGSAVVLAARKAGADLPNLSLPHLSPLPVTVSTHSLNLYKPNLAPTYFFVFIIFIPFTSPLKTCPRTPFTVCVRLTYPVPSLLPTPTFPSQRGIREG